MMNLLTLKRARDHMPDLKKRYELPSFTVGDLVLLKNRNTTALQTKYVPNYRIIKKIGDCAVDLRDNFGNICRANIDDIQTMYPVISSCPIYPLWTCLEELPNTSMIQERFTVN